MEPIDKRDEPSAVLMSDSRDRLTPHDPSEKPIFSSGDVICDRYRVIRFIARGGMGEVYEVEDWELQSRIALKTIAPERASSTRQVGRFRQEIQLARKVSHPNVCRVFDLGRHKMSATPLPANAARSGDPGADRDVLFLTMELLQGQTLSAYLEERGPMTPEQALPIVRQLVSALAAAHHMGIVHRDFKPGNVMLEETPEGLVAKVTDFGLATNPQSDETVSRSLTQVLGTPEYMAPEQLRGQCSNRTDIYALGLTVFQMLTGALPISPDTASKGLKTSETGTSLARGDQQMSGVESCRTFRQRRGVLVCGVGRTRGRAIRLEGDRSKHETLLGDLCWRGVPADRCYRGGPDRRGAKSFPPPARTEAHRRAALREHRQRYFQSGFR